MYGSNDGGSDLDTDDEETGYLQFSSKKAGTNILTGQTTNQENVLLQLGYPDDINTTYGATRYKFSF